MEALQGPFKSRVAAAPMYLRFCTSIYNSRLVRARSMDRRERANVPHLWGNVVQGFGFFAEAISVSGARQRLRRFLWPCVFGRKQALGIQDGNYPDCSPWQIEFAGSYTILLWAQLRRRLSPCVHKCP